MKGQQGPGLRDDVSHSSFFSRFELSPERTSDSAFRFGRQGKRAPSGRCDWTGQTSTKRIPPTSMHLNRWEIRNGSGLGETRRRDGNRRLLPASCSRLLSPTFILLQIYGQRLSFHQAALSKSTTLVCVSLHCRLLFYVSRTPSCPGMA